MSNDPGASRPARPILRNISLLMKGVLFLLTVALVQVCSSIISQRVSIAGENMPLETVLAEIRKQTGIEFFYPSALLETARPVTLEVHQMPVEEVLKICLQGQGLDFSVSSGTVIIFKEE
ncbi:STN domain-containing protein [Paraflavitalea pollutisoli]|uniref:STN domain-containing protein n=1 Tax=Paraflavitalea pollutisoli TaxID=3034143 RepID=UPI0023EC47AA|nr:STN domain-containing protein [Paraflavitalea sp. H1-2-19X]